MTQFMLFAETIDVHSENKTKHTHIHKLNAEFLNVKVSFTADADSLQFKMF